MQAETTIRRVVILGGKGMLGRDLAQACAGAGIEALCWDREEIDVCDEAMLANRLPAADWIINCAAYTRVDDAEKERQEAMRINGLGAGAPARACAAKGLRLMHISTDYVFNGRKGAPWVEDDPVEPLNYYGVTKLEGERQVEAAGGHALIVRTQSLYGLNGRNFIKAILNQIILGKTSLRVVSDQVSSPTYTPHLSDALIRLMRTGRTGRVHVASSGSCSWHAFACAIVAKVKPSVVVEPLGSAELNYPAARPAYSVLDTSRYSSWTGHRMPGWEQGLAAYLAAEPMAGQAATRS